MQPTGHYRNFPNFYNPPQIINIHSDKNESNSTLFFSFLVVCSFFLSFFCDSYFDALHISTLCSLFPRFLTRIIHPKPRDNPVKKGEKQTPQRRLFFQTQFQTRQRQQQSFSHPLPAFRCSPLARSRRKNKVNHRNNLKMRQGQVNLYVNEPAR